MKKLTTLLYMTTALTLPPLYGKVKRDEELERYLKFACETGPKGCTANVRGCYEKITRDLARCRRLHPKDNSNDGYIYLEDECAQTLYEYMPLNKLGRVTYCAEYFVEHVPHDRRD